MGRTVWHDSYHFHRFNIMARRTSSVHFFSLLSSTLPKYSFPNKLNIIWWRTIDLNRLCPFRSLTEMSSRWLMVDQRDRWICDEHRMTGKGQALSPFHEQSEPSCTFDLSIPENSGIYSRMCAHGNATACTGYDEILVKATRAEIIVLSQWRGERTRRGCWV